MYNKRRRYIKLINKNVFKSIKISLKLFIFFKYCNIIDTWTFYYKGGYFNE